MSGAPHRTSPQPSEVIDRQRLVGFCFNGRAVTGFSGDTIVSALMANGVRAYAQGRRLQRRRGVLTADRFDPSCLLPVSYTHLRAHETPEHLVCRLLLEKKN